VIDAHFDVDADGFAYADDAFRTSSAAISLAAARQVAILAALLFVASLLARTLTRPAAKP